MMISIITPTNDDRYLGELYHSILDQTNPDWEWVLIPNGKLRNVEFPDPRVKVYPLELDIGRVGALKYWACKHATGDIIIEVDHDDMLFPNALQRLQEVYDANPDVCFVYSNSTNMDTRQKPWLPVKWSEYYGWSYRNIEFQSKNVVEARSADPYPQNISRIWFAPNHFRSWRARDYWAIGGHDQSMKISDDHDLICRFYLYGNLYHIDECLYFYRVHGDNTWLQNQQEIQDTMWENHNKYFPAMMMKWSKAHGLRIIDLCGGLNCPSGYESIDKRNADIICDLDHRWDLEDNSVGFLRAFDAIEHLRDPIHTMMEAYRVLTHGGVFHIAVPSTDGRGAFQDPTHISFWNENSFWYYTMQSKNGFIDCPVRFQRVKLVTGYMDDFGRNNNIPYVFAQLIAIKKNEPRFYGPLDI